MSRAPGLHLALFSLALAGCAGAPPPATTAAPPPPQAPTGLPAPRAALPPGLDFRLRPDGAQGELVVELVATGPAEALATLVVPEGGGSPLERWSFDDEAGPLRPKPDSTPRRLTFTRPVVGSLRVRAHWPSRSEAEMDAPAVWVDPDRFEARGEAILPLPEAFLDLPLPVRLRVETSPLGSAGTKGGSTFGASEDTHVQARGLDLARATYAAGPAGMALFDAPEGHDEALWIGYTAFDPRPIAADVASFRTAARTVFGDATSGPSTFLIVTDARKQGSYHVERRSGGLVLHVSAAETWSAPLRITVATAVLQRWLGGELWIGPEGARSREALWFTEGLTRFLARDLLFRFGLVTAEEVALEVEGQLATALTSPHAERPQSELAGAMAPGVVPLLAARGALYAARVDGLLRAKSDGKTSLVTVLRALLGEARRTGAALPLSRWTASVGEALGAGADEAKAFERHVERGEVAPFASDALGPCLRTTTRRYVAFDLGFDLAATRGQESPVVRGLDPKGPAYKAGLRDGDLVEKASFEGGRPDVTAVVETTRGGKARTLRYLPAGKSADGQGFARTAVSAERCVR